MSLLHRLRNLFRPGALDRELDEELRFHREMRTRKAIERGLDAVAAANETSRRMGNVGAAAEAMRDTREVAWLAGSLRDMRHGFTVMRREAGQTSLILAVLALGIGGNAAVFSILKAAFLDPLPFPHATRLVTLEDRFPLAHVPRVDPTIPEFIDVRDRNRVFEDFAFLDHRDFQLTNGGEPVRVFAARVTASFFSTMGLRPAMGRALLTEENQPGRESEAIVTDSFWRASMAADPHAVGRTLNINGSVFTVVGVLPPHPTFEYPALGVPEPVDIYVPFVMSDYYISRASPQTRGRRVISVARLRPGLTVDQASRDIAALGDSIRREHPDLYPAANGGLPGFSMYVQPLQEAVLGNQGPLLLLLIGGMSLILMIGCANTAQLLLARSLKREREVAVRAALGASRARLIRQFLLEVAVLALTGGALGLLLSVWLTKLLVALLPLHNPMFDAARPDAMVLLFTIAVSLATALLFGIVPAIQGTRPGATAALTARTAIGGGLRSGRRWRHAMIASEVALSALLLCAAALLCQNLWTLLRAYPGFDISKVAVMRLRLPFSLEQAANPMPSRVYRDYLEKIAAIPGVEAAAAVSGLPLRGGAKVGFTLPDSPNDPGSLTRQIAGYQIVSPQYFQALQIPILAGRGFRDDDTLGHPLAVVVNELFVRRFLSPTHRNPLGSQITVGQPLTIVGVVGNVRTAGANIDPEPQIYVSYLQRYEPNMYLVMRSALPAPLLFDLTKNAVRSVHSQQAIFAPGSMYDVLDRSVAEPRFQALLIAAFATLALIMATTGMYSVISCVVSQRGTEIAIRMALGASRRRIAGAVVREMGLWVSGGLAAGITAGAAASDAIRKISSATVPADPILYPAVLAIFLVVAALASAAPVIRAMSLDPASLLRSE